MSRLIAIDAFEDKGNIILQKYSGNEVVITQTVSDFYNAAVWLSDSVTKGDISVCYSLIDFTRIIFNLIPEELRKQIEQNDRLYYDGVKIFYANGRYLGLTVDVPVREGSNIVTRKEINIQATKWWVSDNEEEPSDIKAVWQIAKNILVGLDGMGLHPRKITSPAGVLADCKLGDGRKYPTIFSFNQDCFGAMEYAAEIMRNEWRSAYQLGYFEKAHGFDIISAYPAAICKLPDTDKCRCEYVNDWPAWASWGLVKGEVEVWSDISPIVYEDEDGNRINPKGKWTDKFTTAEINWLTYWKAGTFKLEDGWAFAFEDGQRPYRDIVKWLWWNRINQDKQISAIARKMSQGLSGKLDEDRQDDSHGDYYNPILACLVRSSTRIKVADFIYNNGLQQDLISVNVDGIQVNDSPMSQTLIEIGDSGKLGNWRYEGCGPLLSVSKGGLWRPNKRPNGISYDQLISAIEQKPDNCYYEFDGNFGRIRTVDLMLNPAEADRVFSEYPESGADLMNRHYKSEAITICGSL